MLTANELRNMVTVLADSCQENQEVKSINISLNASTIKISATIRKVAYINTRESDLNEAISYAVRPIEKKW